MICWWVLAFDGTHNPPSVRVALAISTNRLWGVVCLRALLGILKSYIWPYECHIAAGAGTCCLHVAVGALVPWPCSAFHMPNRGSSLTL